MSKLILDLLPLETRVNPAGAFTSNLSGTTLTLTGTDAAESILILDDGVGMTIIGQNGTTIDGDGLTTKSFASAVNSIKIVAKGGDDSIGLDPASPLSLSGKLDIDLGNSTNNNSLNLVSPLAISLGSVRIISGTGQDIVVVGGSTATVAGDFAVNYGTGVGELFLQAATVIQGNLSMVGGVGYNRLELVNVTVNKNLSFNAGDGDSDLQISSSTINGNVMVSGGRGDDTVALDNATIAGLGGLSVIGKLGKATVTTANNDVNLTKGGLSLSSSNNDATLVVGSLLKTIGSTTVAGRSVVVNANAEFQTKALMMNGPYGSTFNGNGPSNKFGGDVKILAAHGNADYFQSSGTLNAQGAILVSGISANFFPNGNTASVGGDVKVLASSRKASFDRSASSQYTFSGNVTVQGAAADVFFSSGFGSVAKNLSAIALSDNLNFNVNGTVSFAQNLTIKGANAPAVINATSNTASVQGNLTISTGEDADSVTINGLVISGATSIKTGGGGDTLSIDNGAKFVGKTFIDTGSGDDILQFARAVGLSSNAVEFSNSAIIRAGSGNDQLQLGRSFADLGDSRSLAMFVAGATVDGGSNLNSFDDELGQTIGSPTILNWTDPTPP